MTSEVVRYRVYPSSVAFEDLEDEVIVIQFATGFFYSLRGTARELWHMAVSGTPRDEIVAAVAEHAGRAEAGDEAMAFLHNLWDEFLILDTETATRRIAEHGEVKPAVDSTSPDHIGLVAPYSPPSLEKFDDLVVLFGQDPIHEVTEAGWPHQLA